MRFWRRIAVFLGFDGSEVKDDEDGDKIDDINQPNYRETGLPRKGFGVQVQVAVERPLPGPIMVPGDGSVQGLRWYAERLRIDEDGDVADEFLDEVTPQTSATEEEQHRPLPKFVRYSARPVKVKKQIMTPDGKLGQCVEYQGRLKWV